MELKVKMDLNNKQSVEATFDGADLQDVILKAGVLLDFEGECGFCKSENLTMRTRKVTKDGSQYKYTEFICRDCKATRKFGKHQDGNSFFLKDWEEPYKG